MRVTDLDYALENKLVQKLDIMIKRCTTKHPKRDALLINEGSEGEGKTNSSICEAYYAKYKTDREVYLFFKLRELIEMAKNTYDKIFIWDEPSLDSLAIDHYKETNIQLMRLLMTARKRRHFFIINMTKFWKFNEYIVVDRNLGLIHMYSRKEIQPGRFIYVRKKNLEGLYLGYKFSKRRQYKKYMSFGGAFPDIMEKHFDKMGFNVVGFDGKVYKNATYDIYEKEKDKAILSIGTNEKKDNLDYLKLKYKYATLPGVMQKDKAEYMDVDRVTLQRWSKLNKKYPEFDKRKDDA